jgi:galactose mutarotase-like enzyme
MIAFATRAVVAEDRFRGQSAITLTAGELSATFLPQLGMTGVSMRCGGREHLALPGGLPALRAGSTLGLPLLAPWANRLARWRYDAAGVDVDLEGLALGTDRNGLPIHGLLVGRPGWRVGRCSTRRGRARLRAAIDVDSPAFPFPHRIDVAVAAGDRRLTIETTVTPIGDRSVPIAFGWHPYLRLPGTPRHRWRLRLPDRRQVALDALGIPSGGEEAESAEAEPLGRRTFDDLYVLDHDRELALESEDVILSMRAERGYPYAQVWVPSGRPFASLEPMSARTNSLVDGSAALVEPGDSSTASFTLAVEEPG